MNARILSTLTLAALLSAVPTATAGIAPNYVDNPSFEDSSDGPLTDWRVIAGSPSLADHAPDGDKSAQMEAIGQDTRIGIAQNISLANEDPPTPSGTSYNFTWASHFNTGRDTFVTEAAVANATVLWKDALGNVVEVDAFALSKSDSFVEHQETVQAPLPDPGELPVTEAEIQFQLDSNDRADATLFVDEVGFELELPS